MDNIVQDGTTHIPSHTTDDAATLAARFAIQGIRHEANSNTLWCSLCTTQHIREHSKEHLNSNSADFLVTLPETTQEAVLRHCASGEHLKLFEQHVPAGSLEHWLPVELHGRRVLVDHHCLYPSAAFGLGRVLLDETLCGGVVLSEDVCGGVKLWPKHKYSVVELVLPAAEKTLNATLQDNKAHNNEADDDSTCSVSSTSIPRDTCERSTQLSSMVYYESAALPTHVQADLERALRACEQDYVPSAAPAMCAASTTTTRSEKGKKVTKAIIASLSSKTQHSTAQRILPSFIHERRSVRSRRAHRAASAAELIRLVNVSIAGEAALRRQRRRRFARENYAKPI